MKFYIEDWKGNQRKISKEEAVLTVGAEYFKKMIADAKETYEDDPESLIEYMVNGGRLAIEFKE
jgi:hypothetical protein